MPKRDAELKARLLATFQVEAEEHLTALREELAHGASVETAFREMHTLKGAARSVGLREVERVCAACEALLSAHQRSGDALSESVVALLEEAVAAVGRMVAEGAAAPGDLLERLERAAKDPAAAAPAALAPAELPQPSTIRMATDDLDALLRRGEGLLAVKLVAGEWAAGLEDLIERIHKARAAPDPAAELRALEAPVRGMLAALRRDQRAIASVVDGVLEETRRVRMLPAATVFDLFPLMVRDLARSQGKLVAWSAVGGELRVDRRVLEAIKDPLIHIVRNAVDHGIEPPAERAGKPPQGRIEASIRPLEGGWLELLVRDDGRGIDPERVRDAARRARIESDEDPLSLVFRSGLSTSFVITDVSGHGLGLAIVKEQVERIGGRVELDSRPGAGTTIRLVIPATITTFRALLVRAGDQRFLLGLDAVERALALEHDEPLTQQGREVIERDGEVLECAPLAALLGLAGEPDDERRACVIVASGGRRVGLIVDEVAGEREVLVKEFEPPLIRVRNFSAAGLLGAGELVLILRPADLVAGVGERRAEVAAAPREETAPEPPWVLVVDDAVTTRAMERGLLEMAGYQVKVAVDGVDAWTALKSEHFDLVVSDVDMPRMNGFDLTARIRADEELADIPVVLVSALEAREDKERGIEVGANAYVVKSSFEQSNLLEIIHRLGVRPGA